MTLGKSRKGIYYTFKVRHREVDLKFNLISVYGPAQVDQKSQFLSEIMLVCSKEALPIVIGGDFNIIRRPDEISKGNYNDRWSFMFNVVINSLNLREIEMSRLRLIIYRIKLLKT